MVFLEISQYSRENTCARLSSLIKLQSSASKFIKKETLAQVFSCEFCEISKNIFFSEYLWATASGLPIYASVYCSFTVNMRPLFRMHWEQMGLAIWIKDDKTRWLWPLPTPHWFHFADFSTCLIIKATHPVVSGRGILFELNRL